MSQLSFRTISKMAFVIGSALLFTASAQAVSVGYDPTAPESNFGAPTNISDNVAYNISVSSDSTYVNVSAAINPAGGGGLSNLDFVNLYFATAGAGSTVGFEIGNNDAFIPGVSGSVSTLTNGFVINHTTPGNWNISIPWTFFETDPDNLGFATNDTVRLNLSQSFGYSVAGGEASYGDDRLGVATLDTLSTPETTTTLSLMSVVFAGVAIARKRFTV